MESLQVALHANAELVSMRPRNPNMIDRIGPTRRPQRKVRGYQNWRSLLFLHWPVPVADLRQVVPESLQLDVYEDVAYVGMVPFVMQRVRPRWWPACSGFNFLEMNIRTYVVHENQPGVYFFSLDADSALAVWAARKFWGLPYYHAEMSIEHDGKETHYQIARRRAGIRHDVRYRVGESVGPSQPDTLEHFFLERYLMFVERHGKLHVGQVHHTPYPAHTVELLHVDDGFLSATGFDCCEGPPAFAHFASGVDVEVFDLVPI